MMAATLDRTLSLPELAAAWGWPQERLRRLARARRIPHLRDGHRIYFELSAVEAWKERRRQRETAESVAVPHRHVNEHAALQDLIEPGEYPWE